MIGETNSRGRATGIRRATALLVAALASAVPPAARADSGSGTLRGTVTEEETGKPLAGVTVTVTSPALQGESTEFTDADGNYTITNLPIGEYLVRFYYSDLVIERNGIVVSADKTLVVSGAIATSKAKVDTYAIVERAPTVDVANTQVQTEVSKDLVDNTPVRGRTFSSVLTMAPGAATDDVGTSFSGGTGPENRYLIDGFNATNPSYGLLSAPVPLEFIQETSIITGGYNAEYGGVLGGGVVNVITKSGSNEFKGDVWTNVTPFALTPSRLGRIGEAVSTIRRYGDQQADLGFTLGGPILNDRIWFFVGFAPTLVFDHYDRIIRARAFNNVPAGAATYAGDLDTRNICPSYIRGADPALCTSGGYLTQDTASRSSFTSRSRLLAYMGKLDLRIDDDNRLTLQYLGNPSTFSGVSRNEWVINPTLSGSGFNGSPETFGFQQRIGVHDVSLRYSSKLLEHRLQVDAMAGIHAESDRLIPGTPDVAITDQRLVSLAGYEDVPDCRPRTVNGVLVTPCPVQNYAYGGYGFVNSLTTARYAGTLALTYFLDLVGVHALKVGTELAESAFDDRRYDTGGEVLTLRADGRVRRDAFVSAPAGSMERVFSPDGFEARTRTETETFYLRDSWTPSFLPGATLNAGVRWELQQLRNQNGDTALTINDSVAPRLGVVYDWTGKGLSKVFAFYGRSYEAIPLNINNRAFSKEGTGIDYLPQSGCMYGGAGRLDPKLCAFPRATAYPLGGDFSTIAPALKAPYSDEIAAGVSYDVGWKTVLGVQYVHRELGRVIEDASTDGAHTYIIANPGEPAEPSVVADLQAKIAAATDPAQRARLVQMLSAYRALANFPKPTRVYNALIFSAERRLSAHFQVLASYTYSRTIGNYPGLYQASNGQLDPNISSQFDLRDLVLNRDGPLPNDRPHLIKLFGSYMVPVGSENEGVTIGAGFSAQSGAPIEVLGSHPLYGPDETFVLPRGSGGRLPWVTELDIHLAYTVNITADYRLEVLTDVFNALNQKAVTAVDENFTYDDVLPIVNGNYRDIRNLKTVAGAPAAPNPNYGQPIAYQRPLSVRLGARMSF